MAINLIILSLTFLFSCQTQNLKTNDKIKGINWVGEHYRVDSSDFISLDTTYVNYIVQNPFLWQPAHNKPEIRFEGKGSYWGESDSGLVQATRMAHSKNIKVMLKPQIWLFDSHQGKWLGDIEMQNDSAWNIWFSNYETAFLNYAKMAEEEKIESLCIGAELHKVTVQKPEKWRALIKTIRSVYKGKLTYAANWYKEWEEITFWDELDFIGIQAYFPLTKNDTTTEAELLESWFEVKKNLKKVSEKYNKEIIFTELGYKSIRGTTKEPWAWLEQIKGEKIIDLEQQSLAYTAFFKSLWHEPYFKGVFVWKWFPKISPKRMMRNSLDFTPQGKPAQNVIKEWYRK
jgi:hypothetical protein